MRSGGISLLIDVEKHNAKEGPSEHIELISCCNSNIHSLSYKRKKQSLRNALGLKAP